MRMNPGVQKPHWNAFVSTNASWMGWSFRPCDKPSIVVLPFKNLSGDAEQDYFGAGVTESLLAVTPTESIKTTLSVPPRLSLWPPLGRRM